ncbi:hypothetical protein LguiA_013802 [Lonicera macranthoides]
MISKFQAKTSLYFITATGIATSLTFHSLNPNSSLTDSPPLSSSAPNIKTALNGVVRSSRALFTIASNVADYKYSLHRLSVESDEYLQVLAEVHQRSAKRILKLCEANRGFYTKAGQFVAAMRQVPKEYSSTLASLQDQAVPCDFKAIKAVLIHNLGPDLADIFLSLDERPIAAASIAQVHRALLKDNQELAVKAGFLLLAGAQVQYPGLERQMKLDLTTMSFLSKAVTWFFPEYRFQWMVSEFAESIALELGVHNKPGFDNAILPWTEVIYYGYNLCVCVLSQSGKKKFLSFQVDDLEYMKEMKINPTKVAKALAEVFAEMIFVHGFLHGDPHPGNILVSPEGPNGFSLVLLDHGIYKEFDENFRLNYCQLWKALILLDSKKIQQIGEQFGVGKYARYFPLIFTGRTINSKSALGGGMSVDEKKNLKHELTFLRMEDLSSFMESLPSDFLAVLRTDGLLRSLISRLGTSQRERLLSYAKYAVQGLSPKVDPESDFAVKVAASRLKSITSYLQLRLHLEVLKLIYWSEDFRQWLIRRFKVLLSSADYLLGIVLYPISATTP